MRRILTIAALGLAVGGASAHTPPAPAPRAPRALEEIRIRSAPDGAGPSHLFWIAARKGEDVVGVVDPLFAAVRLYAVRRPAPGNPGPLSPRLRTLGACALPIDFRVWQVQQLRDRVVLEGMPDPGALGHAARARDLFDMTFALRRTIVSKANAGALAKAGQDLARAEWDPARAPPCGKLLSRRSRLGASAAYRAQRAGPGVITLTNRPASLAPRAPLTVRATAGRLYAAQELEPAGRLRIVRTSEAVAASDGMLRVRQRYLVFTGRRVTGQFAFDDTRVRGKLGQRPLAVMPSGEALAMGLTGDDRFTLTSCGRVTAPTGLCGPPNDGGPVLPAGPGGGAGAAPGTLDAAALFSRVRPAATLRWQADASVLPADCRAPEGCAVRGQTARFVPLAGLRLSRGLYRRTGMAYAQAGDGLAAASRFTAARRDFTAALRNVHEGRGGLPGNLADGFTGDLGIDCSALIQLAWAGSGGRERLTTLRLQSGPIAYGCPARLPGPGYLRAGDAIALNVTGVLEHAVLFAEPLSIDGASEAWLVLEAASGCGGVCWSLYDPAFFNGWGLYRAAVRSDRPCPAAPAAASLATAPIPRDRSGWLRMLRGGR